MSLIAKTILRQIEKQILKSNNLTEADFIKFCLDYCSNRLFFEIKGRDSEGIETEIKSKVVPIEGEGAEKWSQISGFIGRLKDLVSADELHYIDATIDTKQGGFNCEVYFIKDKEKRFKRTFLSI